MKSVIENQKSSPSGQARKYLMTAKGAGPVFRWINIESAKAIRAKRAEVIIKTIYSRGNPNRPLHQGKPDIQSGEYMSFRGAYDVEIGNKATKSKNIGVGKYRSGPRKGKPREKRVSVSGSESDKYAQTRNDMSGRSSRWGHSLVSNWAGRGVSETAARRRAIAIEGHNRLYRKKNV